METRYCYSPSLPGFFIRGWHEDEDIPSDAIDITEEEHAALQYKPNEPAFSIEIDSNGKPYKNVLPEVEEDTTLRTPEQKLAALGLTKEDLKALLA